MRPQTEPAPRPEPATQTSTTHSEASATDPTKERPEEQVFGITDNMSDNQPTPWTGPPPPES